MVENKCPKCGRKMGMYYRPWCEICDKPEIKQMPVLNFIQAMEHLEALGHTGIKRRLVVELEFRNDSIFTLHFIEPGEEEDYDPQYVADLELIKSTWGIDDFILFDVSW